jgi:competence protein ComEC
VAILVTYGTARALLAGDAEANEEEYMANGPYTGLLTMVHLYVGKLPCTGVPR